MAKAASEYVLYKKGIVITKYGHVKGELAGIECFEAPTLVTASSKPALRAPT